MSADAAVLAACVNWNGGEMLSRTVQALLAVDYPNLTILVVDNASTDRSAERAAALHPDIQLLRLERNRGFAAGVNAAVRMAAGDPARPDYFLILNNDVLLARDALGVLVSEAERLGPGVYGPKILRADDTSRLEAAWGSVTWSHVLANFEGQDAADDGRWIQSRKVSLLLGSALLISREVFDAVGPFDERFFMYHEEVDFLYRVGKAGLPAHFCPAARAFHHGGYSTRSQPLRKVYWVRRNAVLFLRKHGAGPGRWAYFCLTLALSLLYNLATLRFGRVRAILEGVGDGLSRRAPGESRE
jgi:GT2 family glycosyltransferase